MILSEVDDATMAKLEETKTVAAEKSQMRELNLTTWYHEEPATDNCLLFRNIFNYSNDPFLLFVNRVKNLLS